jgi:hypothetical protein
VQWFKKALHDAEGDGQPPFASASIKKHNPLLPSQPIPTSQPPLTSTFILKQNPVSSSQPIPLPNSPRQHLRAESAPQIKSSKFLFGDLVLRKLSPIPPSKTVVIGFGVHSPVTPQYQKDLRLPFIEWPVIKEQLFGLRQKTIIAARQIALNPSTRNESVSMPQSLRKIQY